MVKTQLYSIGCPCSFCGSLNVRAEACHLKCDNCGSVWNMGLVFDQTVRVSTEDDRDEDEKQPDNVIPFVA